MSTVRTKAVDLRMLERRAKVVELVSQATPYRKVAEQLGCAVATVQRDLAEHWEETRPSSETTQHLRLQQDDEYLHLRQRCYALLEVAEDVPAKLQVLDRINRISEHRRRMWGMDLQQNVSVNVLPTAEQLASLFGWDATAVIEGTAVEEITSGEGDER